MHQINTVICRTANRIQLKLLMFGHAVIGDEWQGNIYNPVYSRLYYICSGEAYVVSEDNEKTFLETGKWYLLPAGFSFEYGCENEMEHIYFHLKLCGFDGIDLLRNFSAPVCMSAEKDEKGIFHKCIQGENAVRALEVKHKLFDILLTMINQENIEIMSRELSPCVLKAVKYIKRHLSAKLSMTDIAANAYVSKSTLTKHFNKELSMSVHDYVMDCVLFEAGQLLTQTNMTILAVSEKFGFSDQFYFSRCFKQKFGMSPRDYRKTKLI